MPDAYKVVRDFEKSLSKYTGAPFVVAVESCSAALFLCCQRRIKSKKRASYSIPKFTYPSAASAIVHAGGKVEFYDSNWQEFGWYELGDSHIIDAAKFFKKDMYWEISEDVWDGYRDHGEDIVTSSTKHCCAVCISFHLKKAVPIGRGGAVLTDDKEEYEWLKHARFDGRNECALPGDKLAFPGWNMYMTPEQAARGLELMHWVPEEVKLKPDPYQDLSQYDWWNK